MLSDCTALYQNKLQQQGFHDVVNRNKIKFEPYGDLAGQAFSEFIENSINIEGSHSQIETDEAPGVECPNKSDTEDTEQTKLLQFLTLCHRYYRMMKSQKA